jgi:hypothetical protein
MGPLLLTAAYVGAAGSSGIPRVAWLLAREELGARSIAARAASNSSPGEGPQEVQMSQVSITTNRCIGQKGIFEAK